MPDALIYKRYHYASINRIAILYFYVAKGELSTASAGRYSAIYRNACKLGLETGLGTPVVVIETQTRNVLIKQCDSLTVAVRCALDST